MIDVSTYRIDELDYLIDSFSKGDRISFEKIYKSFYPALYNYGNQFRIDGVYVDDCIQEVFVNIWNSRSRVNIKSLKPYLFRCLRNKILKILSHNVNEKLKAEKYSKEEFEISYYPWADEIKDKNRSDLEKKLKYQIKQLSPKQREIIFLIFYNNLSYLETAEILGIKIKTIYNQIHNSLNSLRDSLKPMILGFVIFIS